MLMYMQEFPLPVSRANVFQARVRVLCGRDDFFHCLFIKIIIIIKTVVTKDPFYFFFVKNEIVMRYVKDVFRVARSGKFIIIYVYVHRIPTLLCHTFYIACILKTYIDSRIHIHFGLEVGSLSISL